MARIRIKSTHRHEGFHRTVEEKWGKMAQLLSCSIWSSDAEVLRSTRANFFFENSDVGYLPVLSKNAKMQRFVWSNNSADNPAEFN